jgi:hypothetical protein
MDSSRLPGKLWDKNLTPEQNTQHEYTDLAEDLFNACKFPLPPNCPKKAEASQTTQAAKSEYLSPIETRPVEQVNIDQETDDGGTTSGQPNAGISSTAPECGSSNVGGSSAMTSFAGTGSVEAGTAGSAQSGSAALPSVSENEEQPSSGAQEQRDRVATGSLAVGTSMSPEEIAKSKEKSSEGSENKPVDSMAVNAGATEKKPAKCCNTCNVM